MKINPQIKNRSKSNFWINSNSGDWIHQSPDGIYTLHLLSRVDSDGNYLSAVNIQLTNIQFMSIKGFIAIKEKKLFSRTAGVDKRSKWAPTKADGTKGIAERTKVPNISESRDIRLKELGL